MAILGDGLEVEQRNEDWIGCDRGRMDEWEVGGLGVI